MKLDIACDSKTVYYTDSSRTIFKYDISGNGTQLANFKQLPEDSDYIYSAFKLLPEGGLIIAMTSNGHGPQDALCLNIDGTSMWTDDINNPDGTFKSFKRKLSDGTDITNITVNLTSDNLNDKIWSLGCYYNFCMNPGVAKFKASDTSLVWFQKT